MVHWLLLVGILVLLAMMYYVIKIALALHTQGQALVKASYPFFTPEQIARCEADLASAEESLKELYGHIMADPAFKSRPLTPTGVLEHRMREAASLEANRERMSLIALT